MNRRNKRIDIIKLIDKKNNFINKNAGIINNLFSKELYTSYVLSHKKKNNIPDYDTIIKNIKKSKSIEKYIIKDITKNIPINFLQYFSKYDFQRFANQLVKSFYKSNDKLKVIKIYNILKNNSISRNKSFCPKITDNTNYSNTIKNENDLNTIKYDEERNLLKSRISHHINDKNKKKNKYIIETISRKNSANIWHPLTIKNNKNDEINEDYIDDDYENKIKNLSLRTKKFKYRNLILKSTNKYVSEDDKNGKKNSNNKDIENLYFNNENNNFRTIYDYNHTRKPEIKYNLLLSLNSDEKPEKKNFSSIKANHIKKNRIISVPKTKKIELILNSFSPKELLITNKTSNILCNLKEIKRGIKDAVKSHSTSKSMKTNILYFTGYNKIERFKDLKFFKSELKKNKRYLFYMKNKTFIERKKNNTFNGLRSSFNTSEKTRANLNEKNFIKTLNNLCDKEKQLERKIDNVYKQNCWLRISKNKTMETNNKNRIDKINKKTFVFNSLLSKMNQLSNNNHNKYSLNSEKTI